MTFLHVNSIDRGQSNRISQKKKKKLKRIDPHFVTFCVLYSVVDIMHDLKPPYRRKVSRR